MTYARVRLDTLFIAPPPPAALALARRPHAVVVPSGDEWGDEWMSSIRHASGRPLSSSGVCDRLMVGGAAAFRADAQVLLLPARTLTRNLDARP